MVMIILLVVVLPAGVLIVGAVVIFIVVSAGMVSTTWVQFLKGSLLVVFSAVLTVMILQRGFEAEAAQMLQQHEFDGGFEHRDLDRLTAGAAFAGEQRGDHRIGDGADGVPDSAGFPFSRSVAGLRSCHGALGIWLRLATHLPGLRAPRSRHSGAAARAVMITMAWAVGGSSVRETSICVVMPEGVRDCKRSAAPPESRMVGFPDGRLTTSMSRQ